MLFVLLMLLITPAHAQDSKAVEICGLYAYSAQVTEVYDGDTITADIDLGFNIWRRGEKLRLHGIDAPEMRGEEKLMGKRARDALRRRILYRDVIVCTYKDKTGKYGRYLADIYLNGENMNDWLVEEGFADVYAPAKTSDLSVLFPTGPRFVPTRLPIPELLQPVQSK
ncbi:MAG: thermonuclease family protein [Pseudomonadota bacterium]